MLIIHWCIIVCFALTDLYRLIFWLLWSPAFSLGSQQHVPRSPNPDPSSYASYKFHQNKVTLEKRSTLLLHAKQHKSCFTISQPLVKVKLDPASHPEEALTRQTPKSNLTLPNYHPLHSKMTEVPIFIKIIYFHKICEQL